MIDSILVVGNVVKLILNVKLMILILEHVYHVLVDMRSVVLHVSYQQTLIQILMDFLTVGQSVKMDHNVLPAMIVAF